MTLELMQDASVTLLALGAAAVILRRALALFQTSKKGPPGCSSCPSRTVACARPSPSRGSTEARIDTSSKQTTVASQKG